MKGFLKEIRPALFITAFLLILGIAGAVHNLLYNGASPESRARLAEQRVGENVQFLEEQMLLDNSVILWLFEKNGNKGYVRFMESQDGGYYAAAKRLGSERSVTIDSAWNREHDVYIVFIDRDDVAYLEYEIYGDDVLWKSEKIPADWLMVVDQPNTQSSRATFRFYDQAGNVYE